MKRLSIHALFGDVDEVRRSTTALLKEGVAASDLEVLSASPLPPTVVGKPAARSWVLVVALVGAVLGGSAAYLIASGTALAYPLRTGLMGIVALPPVAIVTYEGTALGLILATVGAVLAESRWRRVRGPSPLAKRVAEGGTVVVVEGVEENDRDRLIAVLDGAEEVVTVEA